MSSVGGRSLPGLYIEIDINCIKLATGKMNSYVVYCEPAFVLTLSIQSVWFHTIVDDLQFVCLPMACLYSQNNVLSYLLDCQLLPYVLYTVVCILLS